MSVTQSLDTHRTEQEQQGEQRPPTPVARRCRPALERALDEGVQAGAAITLILRLGVLKDPCGKVSRVFAMLAQDAGITGSGERLPRVRWEILRLEFQIGCPDLAVFEPSEQSFPIRV